MSALAPSSAIGLDPALTAFFLRRLEILVLRQMTTPIAHERAALAQTAFAVYLDCLDLGLDREAGAILAYLRVELAPEGRIVA